MYELIAPNQVGKPVYETYIDNNVVTIAELLRAAGYHTYLSGKWHRSGNGITPGTLPYDTGFEHSLTLVEDGANHISSAEYVLGWQASLLYDADMFTDKLL